MLYLYLQIQIYTDAYPLVIIAGSCACMTSKSNEYRLGVMTLSVHNVMNAAAVPFDYRVRIPFSEIFSLSSGLVRSVKTSETRRDKKNNNRNTIAV